MIELRTSTKICKHAPGNYIKMCFNRIGANLPKTLVIIYKQMSYIIKKNLRAMRVKILSIQTQKVIRRLISIAATKLEFDLKGYIARFV